MGIINPESNIVGSISANKEINIATCCVLAMVEIKIPNESARVIKSKLSANSKTRLPCMGILNTKYPRAIMVIAFIKASAT